MGIEEEKKMLIEKARESLLNAYPIVSGFPVGAAVLTKNGNIYQGCNVESVIAGLGTCAERNAICHAATHGEYLFEAIAVVSKLEEPIKPCGVCLQFIGEFAQLSGKDIKLIMVGSSGKIKESSIRQMLPDSFGPVDLNIDLSEFKNK